jgi:dTDP-4-dehydrorhamnose reductase
MKQADLMKIVITGARGQLGLTLQKYLSDEKYELVPLTHSELDISDETAVNQTLSQIKPDVIINAAAYTAVDKAETNDLTARAANATGPKNLARWAAKNKSYLIHISTDFVFSGCNSRPYTPEDQTDPLSIYGRTKLEGELHSRYLAPDNCLVLRTSWVYSEFGNNFVKTMLRLMTEKESLNVVADQIGTPSSTWGLARCIAACLEKKPVGILHWTDAGVASWYDFAVAIQDEAVSAGLLTKAVPIHAIQTVQYPTPAKRPSFSVLDKTAAITSLSCEPVHWRHELVSVIKHIKAGS